MPEKEPFHVWFDVDNRIRVRITTVRGKVSHFTVQYETQIERTWYPVVRCDSAHGQAHIDYLNDHGETVAKTELGVFFPFDEALQWALEDFSLNWPSYRQRFLLRKGRS